MRAAIHIVVPASPWSRQLEARARRARRLCQLWGPGHAGAPKAAPALGAMAHRRPVAEPAVGLKAGRLPAPVLRSALGRGPGDCKVPSWVLHGGPVACMLHCIVQFGARACNDLGFFLRNPSWLCCWAASHIARVAWARVARSLVRLLVPRLASSTRSPRRSPCTQHLAQHSGTPLHGPSWPPCSLSGCRSDDFLAGARHRRQQRPGPREAPHVACHRRWRRRWRWRWCWPGIPPPGPNRGGVLPELDDGRSARYDAMTTRVPRSHPRAQKFAGTRLGWRCLGTLRVHARFSLGHLARAHTMLVVLCYARARVSV